MEHEAGECLNLWVTAAIGWRQMKFVENGSWIDPSIPWQWRKTPYWSQDLAEAYRLMEWIWEREPHAHIHRDRIELEYERTPLGSVTVRIIRGPTFPLRVCRAALWLAEQTKDRGGQ